MLYAPRDQAVIDAHAKSFALQDAHRLTQRFNTLYPGLRRDLQAYDSLDIVEVGAGIGLVSAELARLSKGNRFNVRALEPNQEWYEAGQRHTRGLNVSWHDLKGYTGKSAARWEETLLPAFARHEAHYRKADVVFYGEQIMDLPQPAQRTVLTALRDLGRPEASIYITSSESHAVNRASLADMAGSVGLRLTQATDMPDPFARNQKWFAARLQAA